MRSVSLLVSDGICFCKEFNPEFYLHAKVALAQEQDTSRSCVAAGATGRACLQRFVDISCFVGRTHSVILVDSMGSVDYIERTMQQPIDLSENEPWVTTRLQFGIQETGSLVSHLWWASLANQPGLPIYCTRHSRFVDKKCRRVWKHFWGDDVYVPARSFVTYSI